MEKKKGLYPADNITNALINKNTTHNIILFLNAHQKYYPSIYLYQFNIFLNLLSQCLVSVTSCQDWEITTIEGIGDRSRGYHPVQKTLAEYNGTQCGYCSPGFVMSMYRLVQYRKFTRLLGIFVKNIVQLKNDEWTVQR